MQKRKTWNACLEKKFIDTVVKLGGSQGLQIQTIYKVFKLCVSKNFMILLFYLNAIAAATTKKLLEHMKDDGITISELKKHLEVRYNL